MIKLGTATFVLLLFVGLALGAEDLTKEWRANAEQKLGEARSDPSQANVMAAAAYLAVAERGEAMEPDHREVVAAITETIRSVNDYPRHFNDELLNLREANTRRELGDYNFARQRVFFQMQQFRDVVMLELLIELLDDSQDFFDLPGGADLLGNDTLAGSAICEMIEDLPLPRNKYGYYTLDVAALKGWGRDVLDGSRSFRFKGDPRKFTIHGPVEPPARVVKASPVLTTIPREPTPAAPNRTPALILAMVVLLAAVAALLAPRICKANRG
ncbi:hypothetical protein [Luteolibacter luteus]|uniref:Uncharacterized protein n=1 Tax=Luteolibacter luteus TaxID=2728835 RepID=A0A858REQ7_9BACT|nr:hypothetical protein [Luteolibacter luteus]QJE94889.1 hypothetical protein HHL09_03540 [Luteolibacter luteus]